MGTLLLLRHGQASAQAQDYDQLSPLGEDQARRLGDLWVRNGVRVDRLLHGPRRRQRGTARILFDKLQQAGRAPALFEELPDLDEMQIEGLLADPAGLLEQAPDLAGLFAQLSEATDPSERSRAFMALGARVIRLWVQGRIGSTGIETFDHFRVRVQGALARAREGAGKGARVVCATSAGVIAAAAQLHLGLDADHTCELLLRVKNSSITELLFSGPRVTFASFNEVPHLADFPALHTLV